MLDALFLLFGLLAHVTILSYQSHAFIVLGACDLYGSDLQEHVVDHYCRGCVMLKDGYGSVPDTCGGEYWANVTNCLVDPSSTGIVHPGNEMKNCKEKYALLCECEELVCPMAPTSSPSVAYVPYEQLGTKMNGMDRFGMILTMTSDYLFVLDGVAEQDSTIAVYSRSGDEFALQQTITIPDETAKYGAIAANGEHLFIATPGSSKHGTSYGAVYYYTLQGSSWNITGESLIGSQSTSFSYFGTSIDLSNTTLTLAVGAYVHNNGRGQVYIFRRTGDTWSEETVFTGAVINTYLGATVKLSSDDTTLAIGCYRYNEVAETTNQVHVYVYEDNAWVKKSELTGYIGIGYSMAFMGVSAHTLIVVAADVDPNTITHSTSNAMLTYAWQNDTYELEQTMTVNGTTVLVHDNTLFLGNGDGVTNVYQQQEGQWELKDTLQGTGGDPDMDQGYTLAANAQYLVIGAPLDDTEKGAVWVFKKNVP